MLKRGIVFAMESEEASVTMVDASVMDVTSDIVDDVEVPAGEVEEYVESIDSAHDDIETLDKINDVMTESVESGKGLDPTAAQIAEIAVESIRARVGIIGDDKMPAMEAFGARGSRVAATKLAMESIGDSMTKVWNAIKAAFKKVWDMLKNLYKKFFDGATKLKAAAESSLKRAQSMQGAAEKDILKLPTVYAAFVKGGKVSGSNVVSILDNHIEVTRKLEQIPSSIVLTVDKIRKYTSEGVTKLSGDILLSFVMDIPNRGNDGLDLASYKEYRDFFGLTNRDKDDLIIRSDNLAFNRAMYYVRKKTSENTYSTTYSIARFDVNENGNNQTETESESEISVLDPGNIRKVAEKVKGLADTTIKFNAESKKIKDIDKHIRIIFDNIDRNNKLSLIFFNKKIAPVLRDVIKTTSSVLAGLPRDNIRVGRVALDYVNASISEYKKI